MQHDIEIIPGTSGTMGHELGLVLNYKIPASGKPVDLSGAFMVTKSFFCSAFVNIGWDLCVFTFDNSAGAFVSNLFPT